MSAIIKVMLVDDSAVVRGLMSRALKEDEAIQIVASASNGQEAIDMARSQDIDVIILDIEMPVMDGLTALPVLQKLKPDAAIIMASTLTQRNASISLKAMQMGAADYIPKPTSAANDPNGVELFYRELNEKIKALGARQHVKTTVKREFAAASKAANMQGERTFQLRKPSYRGPAKALVVASSTGGPKALLELFKGLKGTIDYIPVFVTQHMPATFTTMLAQHIDQDTGCRCVEAEHGMLIEAGCTYLARGNHHMILRKTVNGTMLELNQEPPVNFCRPAADPMLSSAAMVYGEQCLGVVLTGMGVDGLEGARAITQAGGTMLVQDEKSSVVWGMPGAVAKEGLASAVVPLSDMAGEIAHYLGKQQHAT